MADSLSIEFSGMDGITKSLAILPPRYAKKVVAPAIKSAMQDIVLKDAVRKVPVRTGQLRRSLKVRVAKGRAGQRLPRGVVGFAVVSTKTKTRDPFYALWVFTGAKNRDGTKRVGTRTLRNALYGNQGPFRSSVYTKMKAGWPTIVAEARLAGGGK